MRFVPDGGALVEVTVRTKQSRLLLRPSRALNRTVLGVLGRAQRRYQVGCCGVVCMSNHIRALLRVHDAQQLARFMQYVDGNLALEVGRLVDWPHGVWSRRYQAIVVSDVITSEPPHQVLRKLELFCKMGAEYPSGFLSKENQ